MAHILIGTCSWSDHRPLYPEGIRPHPLSGSAHHRRLPLLRRSS